MDIWIEVLPDKGWFMFWVWYEWAGKIDESRNKCSHGVQSWCSQGIYSWRCCCRWCHLARYFGFVYYNFNPPFMGMGVEWCFHMYISVLPLIFKSLRLISLLGFGFIVWSLMNNDGVGYCSFNFFPHKSLLYLALCSGIYNSDLFTCVLQFRTLDYYIFVLFNFSVWCMMMLVGYVALISFLNNVCSLRHSVIVYLYRSINIFCALQF